jgi:hypothetical protein
MSRRDGRDRQADEIRLGDVGWKDATRTSTIAVGHDDAPLGVSDWSGRVAAAVGFATT